MTDGTGTSPVRLTGVRSLRGVNALREDQELHVAAAGITFVFSENGAGKSGYVRVLKQVCRARGGRDAVHRNVYTVEKTQVGAVVTFEAAATKPFDAVDGDSAPNIEFRHFDWRAGVAGPPEIAQVSVFDSRSASGYVIKEEVAYLPVGTDLFPKLVEVYDRVKGLLETEISALDRERDRVAEIATDTPAYELLRTLRLPSARVRFDRYADLSDEDRVQLERLRADDRAYQAETPFGRAKERRRCAARSPPRAAAALASGEASANVPLDWRRWDALRAMWEAARRYAEHGADPAQGFPPAAAHGDGAVCVLCQQELDLAARARMHGFEEFVRGETRAAVDRAHGKTEARIQALGALTPTVLADAGLLEQIKSLDEELEGILTDRQTDLVRRRDEALAAARADEATPVWSPNAYTSRGACERLDALGARVTAEAALLDDGADPAVRKATEAALHSLESAQYVSVRYTGRLAVATPRPRSVASATRMKTHWPRR